MKGFLVNDRLTAIEGTRTLWHQLLDSLPGLLDKTRGAYEGLAHWTNQAAAEEKPDYIIRNAAYFQRLEVACPVISFVQDIVHGWQRETLLDACAASRLVVFNSEYTRSMYPELSDADYRIIPIGTDDKIFYPTEDRRKANVLWVGSGHPVKGYERAIELAAESTRPWTFVMKDDAEPLGVQVYRRISQEQLAGLASECSVGVCTSVTETQHLAGIEMGMCGLPLVVTNVGAYYERESGPWGEVVKYDFHGAIERAARLDRSAAARYWRDEGFGLPECLAAWQEAVSYVTGVRDDGATARLGSDSTRAEGVMS